MPRENENKRLLITIEAWWPAAGLRNNNSGALVNVGNNGYYWSSTRYSSAYNSYNLDFNYNGNVNPSNANNRSYGFSVRCVQDFTTDTTMASHFEAPFFRSLPVI